VVVFLFVLWAAAASAQGRFDAGAQVVVAHSSEFDANDTGFGGRFAWHPVELLAAEAEMNVGSRVEGLFGVTAGPRVARARPFAKLRPGFLTFRGQPVACILIFPPPLSCVLAAGRTVFALDVGGGVELFAPGRGVIRVDVGDRLLKYPGPSFRRSGVSQDSFFGHDVRFSAGAGVRF
jgi:hypothetical protein